MIRAFVLIIAGFILSLSLLQIVQGVWQALLALFRYKDNQAHSDFFHRLLKQNPEFYPPITVIVPAYNESVGLVASVSNLLSLEYPNFDIVVVNDGSKDDTLKVLKQAFQLRRGPHYVEPCLNHQPIKAVYGCAQRGNLWVIDKKNGGKADAINAGNNFSQKPYFCVIDADSILAANSLQKVVRPFIEYPDTAIAVGGVISGVNNLDIRSGRVQHESVSTSILQNIQSVEYYRSFLVGRHFWDALDANFIISGAFGVFCKAAVLSVGGYSVKTVGEDLELIFKLRESHGKKGGHRRLFFVPDPVCWTETPGHLAGLRVQRIRWQKGMLETLFKHKSFLFSSQDPVFGWVVLPYLWITEVIFVPAVVLGYFLFPYFYLLGLLNWQFFVTFFVVEFLLGLGVSMLSILVKQWQERNVVHPLDVWIYFFSSVIEVFGYRQLNFWWRLEGYVQFLRGNSSWGEIKRQGLGR